MNAIMTVSGKSRTFPPTMKGVSTLPSMN